MTSEVHQGRGAGLNPKNRFESIEVVADPHEDLQEKGPYAYWLHRHSFESVEGGVRMTDRVEYRLPFGAPGWWIAGWWVRRRLDEIFDYRERIIHEVFG